MYNNSIMEQNPKIFISTPCYDAMMTMQYTISLLKLTQLLTHYNIDYMIDFIGNESLIPRARNKSLGNFIESDCTHLLFIDSDIEFPCEAVLSLISMNKDVACCSYPKKSFNWEKMIHSMQNESYSKEAISSRGLDFAYNAMMDSNNKIISTEDSIRVKHASTGFMMIQRDIINKLIEKHEELVIISNELSKTDKKTYGLFCCMIKDQEYLSEDYSFCDRVHNIGGEIWINVKHNLNHIGKFNFKSDIQNRQFLGRSTTEKIFY